MDLAIVFYVSLPKGKSSYRVGFENGTVISFTNKMGRKIMTNTFNEYLAEVYPDAPEIKGGDEIEVVSRRLITFESVTHKSFAVASVIKTVLCYVVRFKNKFGVNVVPIEQASTPKEAVKIAKRNRILDYVLMDLYVMKDLAGKFYYNAVYEDPLDNIVNNS